VEQEERKIVLTVDDTAVILATIRSLLHKNYDVRVCKDASMAKYMVDHIPVDIALLDIDMPGISGFELLDYIRSNPKRKNLPVIFVTGFATKEFIKKAVTSGALDYIIKPIQPDILINKITNILGTPKEGMEKNNVKNENIDEQKPVLTKNAVQAEVVKYLSYMFTTLNKACLSGNCEMVELLTRELDSGKFGDSINKKVDELVTLMISFDYKSMLEIIGGTFNASGSIDL
jgi:response regulator RpfG family c-di-GMP phosphodiesterase